MTYVQGRSAWWYLLPILLGIIGGIIGYFVLRRDDPQKARNCIYLGLAFTAIGVFFNILTEGAVITPETPIGI